MKFRSLLVAVAIVAAGAFAIGGMQGHEVFQAVSFMAILTIILALIIRG